MTFSGGIIDLTLFGILQGVQKSNWLWVIWVGIVYFVIYYFVFSTLIRKRGYVTPGREVDGDETKLYTRSDYNAKRQESMAVAAQPASQTSTAALILSGLGGKENIADLDCCATRLRVTVRDGALVDEALLKESGAAGVIRRGNGIQVVYGPRVSVIKSELEEYMENN